MGEDLEKQKEMQRQIRDQEVEKILAMNKEERKSIIEQCGKIEDQMRERTRIGLGRLEILAIDTTEPSRHRIKGGFGEHGLAALEVEQEIIKKEGDEARWGIGIRIWRGIIHQLPEFQSKVIRMLVNPEDPYFCSQVNPKEKEKYIEAIKRVWIFFKAQYPDLIMVDIKGKPFEEYFGERSK